LKLSAAQLNGQLKDGLAPVYLVGGEEPLIANDALDTIRAAARGEGYDDREVFVVGTGFNWDSVRSSMDTMSLFSARRIIEVRLPTGKPGRTGSAMLAELAENMPPDTLLIVICEQFDNNVAKAKWVTRVADAGVAIIIKPVSPEQLPSWLAKAVKKAGLTFAPDALELLAHHVEGNLLAAQQEIDKLALIAPDAQVSAELVEQSVSDGARFTVFQLADAVLGPDPARAVRVLYGLRAEGVAAPLVLWALVKEATTLTSVWTKINAGQAAGQAMQQSGVWRSRQGLVGQCLRRHNQHSIERLLGAASKADRIAKGGLQGSPWGALLELTQAIGQPQGVIRGQLSA